MSRHRARRGRGERSHRVRYASSEGGGAIAARKPVRQYSRAYPLEALDGATACDCVGRRDTARGAHVLEAVVRAGDAVRLRRAVEAEAAVPYFPVASTAPPGRSGLYELVRRGRAQSAVPALVVVGDVRREQRHESAPEEAPCLLLLARARGQRRRQRALESTAALQPDGAGRLRVDDPGLARAAWLAEGEVCLLGRCAEFVAAREGEVRVRLSRVSLCSLPLQVKGVREVHFGYLLDAAGDGTGSGARSAPRDEDGDEAEERAVLQAIHLERLQQVLALLMPKDWLERYRGAAEGEARVEVLERFIREQGRRLDLRGTAR